MSELGRYLLTAAVGFCFDAAIPLGFALLSHTRNNQLINRLGYSNKEGLGVGLSFQSLALEHPSTRSQTGKQ